MASRTFCASQRRIVRPGRTAPFHRWRQRTTVPANGNDRPDALLSVEDLSAGYGSVTVLERLSIELHEGEVIAILGPNGAGKTTLLRVISGVVARRDGLVRVDGVILRRPDAHSVARMGIGHVPEGRAIFPGLSVADNLELGTFALAGRGKGGSGQETLDRVLELFPRLKERLKQLGGTLSGGEQQMLAIARALMGQPRILLLDEPSLGLSPLMVARVFEALPLIRDQGVSVILVEQNLSHALQLAERGYVLNRGKVAVEGTAAELRQLDLFHAYVGH